MKLKKRIAALLMAGAMVCFALPVNVLAVENSNQNVGGLCQHHTEHNADCGYTAGTPCGFVCGECSVEDKPETATPSNAAQLSAGDVQRLIDELPTANELAAMSLEEQNAVYDDLQAAYEALTDEQKTEVTGAEVFESLFDVFNDMVNTLANPTNYTISRGAVTIDDSCGSNCLGHTITGSSSTNTITVTGGNHHIILNDVNIDVSKTSKAGALDLDTAGICTITLQGSNVLKSGDDRPGIRVPANNKVTINGDGSLEVWGGNSWPGIGRTSNGNIEIQSGTIHAYGGPYAAGIGGSWGFEGGIITINGGKVTANGGNGSYGGAGIGGGANGSGGTITITITSGNVTANGQNGAGIGYGYNGSGSNSFTTETSGGALIFANGGISDKTGQSGWKGIIFEGNTGTVYGDQTLQENLEIPSDKTLTVPKNTTLTVNRGVTLTNNGTIEGYGTLDGEGNLVGSGTVADTIQNNLQKDTFTVTYKTNADVEMGTLPYKVGKKNALPGTSELDSNSNFKAFILRAKQKGQLYVPGNGVLWYEDKEFTKPATFPKGQKDENYTLYCKLTLGSMSAGSVINGAENKSYAAVGGYVQPYLSISGYSTTGRNDGNEATKAIFEKKKCQRSMGGSIGSILYG